MKRERKQAEEALLPYSEFSSTTDSPGKQKTPPKNKKPVQSVTLSLVSDEEDSPCSPSPVRPTLPAIASKSLKKRRLNEETTLDQDSGIAWGTGNSVLSTPRKGETVWATLTEHSMDYLPIAMQPLLSGLLQDEDCTS